MWPGLGKIAQMKRISYKGSNSKKSQVKKNWAKKNQMTEKKFKEKFKISEREQARIGNFLPPVERQLEEKS